MVKLVRCSFCGHAPERHFIDGGCKGCNCPRSLQSLADEAMPRAPRRSLRIAISHAQTPCMFCNATEVVTTCAACGVVRETA